MILRDPERASSESFDVVIVGGGIYGICHAYEAARRSLRTLLLERDDFGGATSWATQRIIHGGFRYLQSLDLFRLRESVQERRWWLANFPTLVRPMPCLMPLYGYGLKRPAIMRAAFAVYNALSQDRGRDPIPTGRVVSKERTTELFPSVARAGLRGGALWYDGCIVSPQRLLMTILHRAVGGGDVQTLNYCEATALDIKDGRIRGIIAQDRINGEERVFSTSYVINTSGPWCHDVAQTFGCSPASDDPKSLAFCVLLDRDAVSEAAVAVSPARSRRPMCFLTPCQGCVLAGTVHLPWIGPADTARPTAEHVNIFLDDLNAAVPDLDVTPSQVLRVFAGVLPTRRRGDSVPATRPMRVDHGRHNGPSGLISVVGVKFTTARSVADHTLERLFPTRPKKTLSATDECSATTHAVDWSRPPLGDILDPSCRTALKTLIRNEAVYSSDDLLFRRTDWGLVPASAENLRPQIDELIQESKRTAVGCALSMGGRS